MPLRAGEFAHPRSMRMQRYPPYGDLDEPGTPSWVGLSSPDLEASKRFYGDLFGWSADRLRDELPVLRT